MALNAEDAQATGAEPVFFRWAEGGVLGHPPLVGSTGQSLYTQLHASITSTQPTPRSRLPSRSSLSRDQPARVWFGFAWPRCGGQRLGLQDELQTLLGVSVDVLTPKDLPPKFRDAVVQEARPV